LLPSLTWNLDPVALKFPTFSLQPVALVGAALGGLSALYAWRKARREGVEDKGGVSFGVMILAAGLLAALVWPDARPAIELRYYSLLFVVVFLVGYAFLNWQIRRGGGGVDEAGDFIVYGVVGVLAGARLGHVLFYDLEKAMDDPVWILKIWTGGLSSHGATVGLIIAMFLFTRSRGIPFLEGSDRFSFSAATGAALVRLGNFFNSEIVGRKTDGTWGVRFPRFDCPAVKADPDCVAPLRHPTQLYEGALALLTLVVLLVADRAFAKEKRPRGAMISLFFAVYFTGRLGIEFTKEYQVASLEGTFTMGQYLSILPALIGWYGLWWSFKKKLPVGWAPAEPEEKDEDEDDDEDDDEGRGRLYDPDVEEVFGSRRKRPERRQKRKTAEERRRDESKARTRDEDDDRDEDEDDDEAPAAKAEQVAEAPVRRRKKRRKAREEAAGDGEASPKRSDDKKRSRDDAAKKHSEDEDD
jgi:phosphatidylglycerol:prolipoprotein diacylglycerol transferase